DGRGNADLADMTAIHRLDLELQPVSGEALSSQGQVSQMPEDIARERRIAINLVHQIAFQEPAQATNIGETVNEIAALSVRLSDSRFFVFIRKLASDSLKN